MDQQKRSNRVITIIGIALSAMLLCLAVFCVFSFFGTREHIIDNELYRDGDSYSMEGISLPPGNYILSMDYILAGGDADVRLNIESVSGDIVLPLPENDGSGQPVFFSFVLDHAISNGRISTVVPEGCEITEARFTLYSDRYIFTDGIAYALLCLLGIGIIWVLILNVGKGMDPALAGTSVLFFLITTAVCVCTDVQHVGVDLRAHLLRIDGIFFGMLDGQFPVVIAPEWNNRHGQLAILYPSIFLYPLALLRMLRVSLYGTLKIAIIIINAISGLVYYKVVKEFFSKTWSRLLALLLITFEYTRIYGITYGGKLGGALIAEIFIPLIVAGLIDVFYREGKKWYYLAIGLAGVFCTHVLTAVIATMMVALFSVFSIRRFNDRKVWTGIGKAVRLFVMLIFGVYAAFFRYYFIDWSSAHLTWSDFISTLWSVSKPFFDARWTYLLALIVTCAALLAVNLYFRAKNGTGNNCPAYVVPTFATSAVLFWMATVYFPWALLRKIDTVKSFTDLLQSGNRFLIIASTLSVFCVPPLLENMSGLLKKRGRVTAYATGLMLTVFVAGCFAHALGWYYHTDLSISDQVSTPVDYRYQDYLPSGTKPEYYASDAGIISDDGIINTLEYSRSGTKIHYRYTASADGEYVEFPMFYYDGYEAIDESGKPISIVKSDRNKIQINIPKTDEAREINIRYDIPMYVRLCYSFSVVVWMIMIIILVVRGHNTNQKRASETVDG